MSSRRPFANLRIIRAGSAAFIAGSAVVGEACVLAGLPVALPGSLLSAGGAQAHQLVMPSTAFAIIIAIAHAVVSLVVWQRCAGADWWAGIGVVVLLLWVAIRLASAPVTIPVMIYLFAGLVSLDFLVAKTGLFTWGLGHRPTARPHEPGQGVRGVAYAGRRLS